MGLSVDLLQVTSIDLVVDVLLELRLEALLIVVGEGLHVLSDVATEDVAAESLGVELLGLDVVAGEAGLGVGDEDTTVRGTLHGSEDTGTGGGTVETDIKESLEGTALAILGLSGLGQGVLALRLLNTDESLIQAELGQGAAGEQETGGVGSGPVGQAVGDAVALELMAVSGSEDLVTVEVGSDDLGDDVAVGEADDHAVLGRVVLVLRLGDQPLAGEVVGLTLPTTLKLRLVAAGRIVSEM